MSDLKINLILIPVVVYFLFGYSNADPLGDKCNREINNDLGVQDMNNREVIKQILFNLEYASLIFLFGQIYYQYAMNKVKIDTIKSPRTFCNGQDGELKNNCSDVMEAVYKLPMDDRKKTFTCLFKLKVNQRTEDSYNFILKYKQDIISSVEIIGDMETSKEYCNTIVRLAPNCLTKTKKAFNDLSVAKDCADYALQRTVAQNTAILAPPMPMIYFFYLFPYLLSGSVEDPIVYCRTRGGQECLNELNIFGFKSNYSSLMTVRRAFYIVNFEYINNTTLVNYMKHILEHYSLYAAALNVGDFCKALSKGNLSLQAVRVTSDIPQIPPKSKKLS